MRYKTLKALFKAICDALRRATGTSALIDHQDIPSIINTLTKSNGSSGGTSDPPVVITGIICGFVVNKIDAATVVINPSIQEVSG